MRVSMPGEFAWGSAAIVGGLSSWLVGTTVMAAALIGQSVLATGSLQHVAWVIVLVPIIGALLFPGALIVGGAAGCLARKTARLVSPRAHVAGFTLLGAVVGAVYARVLLHLHGEIEVGNQALLLAQAGLAGTVAGAVMSTLVRRKVEV